MIDFNTLFKISYGLYIVSSGDEAQGNGYIGNTVFQVTSEPAKFAACCNKDNFTCDLIIKHKKFSVSVLEQNTPADIYNIFGYQSGKDLDKFKGMKIKYGTTGVPIVTVSSVAFLELKLVETIDLGTHLMFIGELVHAEMLDENKDPITYEYYRNVKKGVAPKNAPTYIDKGKLGEEEKEEVKKYECMVCGYIYNDSREDVEFENLPDDWQCPTCSADKEDFDDLSA